MSQITKSLAKHKIYLNKKASKCVANVTYYTLYRLYDIKRVSKCKGMNGQKNLNKWQIEYPHTGQIRFKLYLRLLITLITSLYGLSFI